MLVSELFEGLTRRLDPLIADRLSDSGYTDWTGALADIDQSRGRRQHNYSRTDLQCQLRVLTERLGKLGYPFDDHLRQVTTVSNELRIMRNRWAHNDPLSDLDVLRTADFACRLLTLLGDTAGASAAETRRSGLLSAYAVSAGPTAPATPAPEPAPTRASPRPAPSVSSSTEGLFDYEAWEVVEVGGPEVIDALPKKDAKMQVRGVAAEIAEFEGPVSLDRLVTLTTRSFGMSKCGKKKRQQVSYQLRQVGLTVDEDDFIWPTDIDPATWTEFRPTGPEAKRTFTDISPVEIANAWRIIAGQRPGATRDEVRHAVLGAFGVKRAGSKVTPHLARAEALVRG